MRARELSRAQRDIVAQCAALQDGIRNGVTWFAASCFLCGAGVEEEEIGVAEHCADCGAYLGVTEPPESPTTQPPSSESGMEP